MKNFFKCVLVLLCSLSLISCQNNQDAGVITGGIAGGLLGSTVGRGGGQILAIAAGTIAGAVIGGSIGRNMDRNDRARMNLALERNRIGQPAYWTNDRTGAEYAVVPTRNVVVAGNDYCREYRTVADIGGKKRTIYGTACRQPDGSWQAVS